MFLSIILYEYKKSFFGGWLFFIEIFQIAQSLKKNRYIQHFPK